MSQVMNRRMAILGIGAGVSGLVNCATLKDVFKKKDTVEQQIMEMSNDEFLQQYSQMLFQNAVSYGGHHGDYYFILGAPKNASAQDKGKWDEYQLDDFFNTLFMPDESVRAIVKLFLEDNVGVSIDPVNDLKIVRQNDVRKDILYVGRNGKVLQHTGVRPGHIVWMLGERLKVPERYVQGGVVESIKKYVILQSSVK